MTISMGGEEGDRVGQGGQHAQGIMLETAQQATKWQFSAYYNYI